MPCLIEKLRQDIRNELGARFRHDTDLMEISYELAHHALDDWRGHGVDVAHGKIILEGNVVLKRKNDVLYGNKLIMDLDSGKSRVFSESGEGRVKMRFIPAEK